MITLASLWLPILLSAVFVFIASSIIHMVLPWHKSDFRRTPDEDNVMKALRPFGIPPGDYMLPRCEKAADMKTPEYQAKVEQGPVMVFTVLPNGNFSLGKCLVLWFVYLLVVIAIAAYLAGKTVAAGAPTIHIVRVVATATFLGLAGAIAQGSIWFGRAWSTTVKSIFDGAIYALIVGGTFAWLWPR